MKKPDIGSVVDSFLYRSKRDHQQYWTPWPLLCEFRLFMTCVESLLELSSDYRWECVIALGKSGTPLASMLALRSGRPLYLYTVGELFHPNGAPVAGLYLPDGEYPSRIKALVIDSHINTGKTYNLFKSLTSPKIPRCTLAVLLDTRKAVSKEAGSDICSLYSREDINEQLSQKLGEEKDRINNPEFWMRDQYFWLKSCPLPTNGLDGARVEFKLAEGIPADTFKGALFYNYMNKWNTISPIRLYMNSDLFRASIKALTNSISGPVDTVVACSMGALPLATGIFAEIGATRGTTPKLIFLGNGTRNFFESCFTGSKKILLCDDMVSCGGLIGRVYDQFVGDPSKFVGVAAMLDMDNTTSRHHLAHLPQAAQYIALSKASQLLG